MGTVAFVPNAAGCSVKLQEPLVLRCLFLAANLMKKNCESPYSHGSPAAARLFAVLSRGGVSRMHVIDGTAIKALLRQPC